MSGQVYKLNIRDVGQENIEGEVVAISLTSGSYYSMVGTAADAWELLVKGASAEAIAHNLAGRYDASEVEIQNSVEEFISQLLAESLVVAVPESEAASADFVSVPEKLAFTPPSFERFDDMKDMLILDPIHDVSDAGWPFIKEPKDS